MRNSTRRIAPRPTPEPARGDRICRVVAVGALLLAGLACSRGGSPSGGADSSAPDAQGHTAATQRTRDANRAVADSLPLDDPQDFADATRGLVVAEKDLVIRDESGGVIWDATRYGFVDGEAPASVNPSLWRQAKLNGLHGLFAVADGVWQVRGYDISNMTLIRGQTGWIVVDPLTTAATARAALALARRQLGDMPVVAVILTHSHVDHFGGIEGVLPDVAARTGVRIVAPRGFVEEATSENVLAGVAMGRRAGFMYGMGLARSPRGHVDTGLGKEPARGRTGLPIPTDLIDHTPQEMEIDGVRFLFQYAPDSEAPAEMAFFLPDKKAYCGAEIVSHTMHNLYTLRGAKVRDALRWSGYIDDAIQRAGDVEVVFASHHWPVWGHARVIDYLEKQRDTYRFLHDQSLRLANSGLTPQEIAERLELPKSLASSFANRGYYGTVRHNAKAVYQLYFGWYDGNPANLDPLPRVELDRRMVEAMGGSDEVLRKAEVAFEAGDTRWAATLLDHLVFAAPDDSRARELLARVYDQLGYQAESGPWRDEYLTAAFELRHGKGKSAFDIATATTLLRRLPLDRFLDLVAIRVDGAKAEGKDLTVNFVFTDVGETHVIQLRNSVLHHWRREADPRATATVKLTHDLLIRLATQQAGLKDLVFGGELTVEGSRLDLLSLLSVLAPPDSASFAIVTP